MCKEKDSVYCLRSHHVPLFLSMTLLMPMDSCFFVLAVTRAWLEGRSLVWPEALFSGDAAIYILTLQVPRVFFPFSFTTRGFVSSMESQGFLLGGLVSSLIFCQNSAKYGTVNTRQCFVLCVFLCHILLCSAMTTNSQFSKQAYQSGICSESSWKTLKSRGIWKN